MQTSSDLPKLRKILKLPEGTLSCRWVTVPVGIKSSVPGPTDYRLYAYVRLDDHALRDFPSLPDAGTATVSLSRPVAEAVLPDSLVREAAESNGRLEVTGEPVPIDGLSQGFYHVRTALKVGSGLFISLYTM